MFPSRFSTLAGVVVTALAVLAGCSTADHATGPGGSAQDVTVSPDSSAVRVGSTTTLNATARNGSGSTISEPSFFWSSSDTSIATVNQSGVVSGRNVGTVQIAASLGGVSGVATVTVESQPIAAVIVEPATATLRINTTLQLSDTVKNAAGGVVPNQVVTWTSDNASVASVDAAALVIAHAAGTAHITGTVGTASGTATITVTTVPIASIAITPRSPTIFVQQTAQLTATGKDSAGNSLASLPFAWQSLAASVATVSSTGVVTGVSPGTAVIQASAGGVTGADTVTIAAAPISSVVLSPSTSSLFIGQTEQMSAQVTNAAGQAIAGATVTYSSSNTGVANVNASGLVTAVGVGITTITGTSQGKSGTAAVAVFSVPVGSVTVQPADTTIPPTGTAQMRAVVVDSLGHTVSSPSVSWSSTPTGRVSQSGLVTPQPGDAGGAITVVASSGGKSGGATVSVSNPPPPGVGSVSVQPSDTTITATQNAQMRVTVTDINGHVVATPTVVWTSIPTGRVSATGLVTPQVSDAGNSIGVTATSGGQLGVATVNVSQDGPGGASSVTVAPGDTTITSAQTVQMQATVTDGSGHVVHNAHVDWSSAPTGRVSKNGLVKPSPSDAGNAITVVASSQGASGTASVSVMTPAPSMAAATQLGPGGGATRQ